MSITPTHNIWYFEKAYDLDDFYAALELANEDERLANQLPYADFTRSPSRASEY